MKELYGYLFHFNHHRGLWAAFKRDDREKYFNNSNRSEEDGIIYSKNIQDLIEFITIKK